MAPSLTTPQRLWVERTLAGMSLEERAAQLVFVRADGRFHNVASPQHRTLMRAVEQLRVGGVVLFRSEMETAPRLLNQLQAAAEVPLLVAADLERGLAFRFPQGSVPLPFTMAIGATGSPQAAELVGELTGREARALGIHWVLAPVVDVNNDPANPVINIRSYGEDPELVAEMAAAFVRGARRAGVLTAAKHFPGHGDTATDSHEALPVLDAGPERLAAVELVPFRRVIEAGVDSVMTGHVAVPKLDPSGTPATLSSRLTEELLRGELGFDGLIVTDALEMHAVRPLWTGAAAVRAVRAGADVLLLPDDPRVAVQALVRAVEEGELSAERLDASVERILAAKARLGLDDDRTVDRDAIPRVISRPEDREAVRRIARQSITLVRNRDGVLPLHAERPLNLLHLVLTSRVGQEVPLGVVDDELEARAVTTETKFLGPEVSEESLDDLAGRAGDFSHVLVSAFVTVRGGDAETDLSPSQSRLLERLHAAGTPVVLVSFGSPYLLVEVPELPVYLCAYGWAESSLQAAVAALFGEHEIRGRLPVTLPGLYPAGHGVHLARRPMTLRRAAPEKAGFRPRGLQEIDRIIGAAIERRAFPGAVVAVGRHGRLVHLEPYGRLSYEPDAAPVTAETIYDLASLTKVVATTTMAMILMDEERLDLDRPVREFLPGFRGGGKQQVTVRHLLTHSSGIDWWAPLYEELEGQEQYVERIQSMELVYQPGTQSLYSDLGVILLGELLERVAGESLDRFAARRLFAPLGMDDTLFRPGEELRERIAPTERDPWRDRLLRGEVHDENAYALGGVAPHAGLFGTAEDLARFAEMILNGGVFEHHRIVAREVVELFTGRAGVPESTRALGWDTKSGEGSSAGELFSARSFGHTGFTGTSLWIDPERDLFLILLTNRVHPSRDNDLIRQVRPAVADAVIRALEEA